MKIMLIKSNSINGGKHHGLIWYLLLLFVLLVVASVSAISDDDAVAEADDENANIRKQGGNKKRIAVIGGGISGTFFSKFLADYDDGCDIESITIFDPTSETLGQYETQVVSKSVDEDSKGEEEDDPKYFQGSRVQSIKLDNGRVVEVGASVGHLSAFKYIVQMIRTDPTKKKNKRIMIGMPFNTGIKESVEEKEKKKKGLGIYNGHGNGFALLLNHKDSYMNKLRILLRYNYDMLKLKQASDQAAESFQNIHPLLNNDYDYFFNSPDEMWRAVNLYKVVHSTYDQVLDSLGIARSLSESGTSSSSSWWNWIKYNVLPYQGSLRDELSMAINEVNYNQANDQINGLVGLASFSTSQGNLFSIVGGNHQVIQSAYRQAKRTYRERECAAKNNDDEGVFHVAKKIATVVGDINDDGQFELFSRDGKQVGVYDIVVLAAPIQQARISFYIKSRIDGAVLHQMPLAGMSVVHDDEQNGGSNSINAPSALSGEQHLFPEKLPDHTTRPFTQVVTTVVSNASLQYDYFNLTEEIAPRAILMTKIGKHIENNITAISQITSDGVYKVFSSGKLSTETLRTIFGSYYKLEFVKLWGGKYGGATPDYRSEGKTMNYLLYDSAAGLERPNSKSGALYYINAIEGSIACMEASAIGAKSVAKLIAKKFQWIGVINNYQGVSTDEL